MTKNILIVGGTGIVGKAAVEEAIKQGYGVTVIGLKKESSIPPQTTQIAVDRENKEEFSKICSNLNKEIGQWDIIFDIAAFDRENAEQTYLCFKDHSKHIFILSTTLVYDRSEPSEDSIKSSHPLAKKGMLGGYVDNKLDVEIFWQKITDINWTILRPYHILGPTDSLLGCIPDHNRDPKLLERIKNEEELVLCNSGNIEFNFVHPKDIAKVVLKAAGNSKTFHKCYNVVNPERITAKEYYELIGKELGKEIKIKNKPIEAVWEEDKGWQLTTLPNLYDISDLQEDIGFVPDISIKQAIKEALASYKQVNLPISEIPVHKRMTRLPRPKKIGWLLKK